MILITKLCKIKAECSIPDTIGKRVCGIASLDPFKILQGHQMIVQASGIIKRTLQQAEGAKDLQTFKKHTGRKKTQENNMERAENSNPLHAKSLPRSMIFY